MVRISAAVTIAAVVGVVIAASVGSSVKSRTTTKRPLRPRGKIAYIDRTFNSSGRDCYDPLYAGCNSSGTVDVYEDFSPPNKRKEPTFPTHLRLIPAIWDHRPAPKNIRVYYLNSRWRFVRLDDAGKFIPSTLIPSVRKLRYNPDGYRL
jgi:hypothetical protein